MYVIVRRIETPSYVLLMKIILYTISYKNAKNWKLKCPSIAYISSHYIYDIFIIIYVGIMYFVLNCDEKNINY